MTRAQESLIVALQDDGAEVAVLRVEVARLKGALAKISAQGCVTERQFGVRCADAMIDVNAPPYWDTCPACIAAETLSAESAPTNVCAAQQSAPAPVAGELEGSEG